MPEGLAEMHLSLGWLYSDTDQSAALKQYAAAINVASGRPDLLCTIGDQILQNGQVDLAISVYQRVLQLDPDHRVARERLQRLQHRSP